MKNKVAWDKHVNLDNHFGTQETQMDNAISTLIYVNTQEKKWIFYGVIKTKICLVSQMHMLCELWTGTGIYLNYMETP